MNESLVREIAEQIAQEQIFLQWPYYVLTAALSLFVGFLVAYIGGYARKRGESFATKADFNDLLAQMKSTTELTEQIRSEVSHADWAARELKVLRRKKLEEVLQAIHELIQWQSEEMNRVVFSSGNEAKASPSAKVERIAGLYFPELKQEIDPLIQYHRELVIEMIGSAQDLAKFQPHQIDAMKQCWDQFRHKHNPIYQEQLKLVAQIEGRARILMESIIKA
jgi:hypothetical protein